MSSPPSTFVYPAEYVRAYDADSPTIRIDRGWSDYKECGTRVQGIDTPELRPRKTGRSKESITREKELGYAARDYARKLLSEAEEIIVQSHELDKYGRPLIWLWVDGRSYAEILVEAGHAVRYDGGTKSHDWGAE